MRIIMNKEKKQLCTLSCGLFLLVIVYFGILFFNWGFDTDDCGLLYSSWKLLRDQGIVALFKAQHVLSLMGPCNYDQNQQLSSLPVMPFFYRPLTLLFFAWQYVLFGGSAYSYFFVMVV